MRIMVFSWWVSDFSTGFVNAVVNEEDRYRVGSLGLHYNYGVNRSLDYTVRKVAYTSHSRVGAYTCVGIVGHASARV